MMNMNKPLSFFANLTLLIIAISFIVIAEYQLGQLLNWPAWVYIVISLIVFVLFFEVLAQLSQKRLETPISLFRKFSIHDQHVITIAVLVFLALISASVSIPLNPIPLRWISYAFLFSSFFVPWLTLFLYGSEKVKAGITTAQFRNANAQDKVVILLVYFVRFIGIVFLINLTGENNNYVWFSIVLLLAFIHIPIFLIFGSSQLRNTVMPKWLKKTNENE